MPIERWDGGKPPIDEVEDFARRRWWLHVHAALIGTSCVLGLVALGIGSPGVVALAGLALALSAIAALRCGRTLLTFTRSWLDDGHDWFEDRAVEGEHLASVIAMLGLGLLVVALGAVAWLGAAG